MKNSRGKSALTKSYRHGTVDDINLSKSQRKLAFTSPSQSTQITNRQQTNTFKDTINSQTTKRQSSNALSKLLSAADLHRRPSFLKKATYFKYKPSFLKTFIKEMKPSFKRDASSEVILQSSSLPSTLSQNVKTKKTTTQENIKDLQPTTKTPKHSLRRTKQPMPQATSQTTSSTLSTASSPSVTSSSASTYVPSASLDGSQAPFYYSLTSLQVLSHSYTPTKSAHVFSCLESLSFLINFFICQFYLFFNGFTDSLIFQKSAKKDRSFKTLSLAHRLFLCFCRFSVPLRITIYSKLNDHYH